jgi:hypothetical protein
MLHPAGEVFHTKHKSRLLDYLPQHRLAPGRKTLLQPITPRHEIVYARAHSKRVPNRQGMRDDPGPLPSIAIVEPALISIDAIA